MLRILHNIDLHSLQYTNIAHFRSSYVEASLATRIYNITFALISCHPVQFKLLSAWCLMLLRASNTFNKSNLKHNREWQAEKRRTEVYHEGAFALQRDLKLWAPGTSEYINGQPTFKTEFIAKWNLKKLATGLS